MNTYIYKYKEKERERDREREPQNGVRCLYKRNSVMCKVAAVAIIYIHRYTCVYEETHVHISIQI